MLEKIKNAFNFYSFIWLIGIIVLDLLIFYFSSQTGPKSSSQSGFVLNLFQISDSDLTQTIIRKLAHFSIYACMGICWMNFLNSFPIDHKRALILSILMCFLFAASDEWHQSFVDGRSGELLDVCLDTFGSLCGASLVFALYRYKAHQHKV